MIYTSCYREFPKAIGVKLVGAGPLTLLEKLAPKRVISISGDRGRDANWTGECCPMLAPKKDFWQIWHNGVGKVPEILNNQYYIDQYYKQVLSKLDPAKVYAELDDSILLCYEQSQEFCHRHIVAAWLEHILGVTVDEVQSAGDGEFVTAARPAYIKLYLEKLL